MNKSEVYLIIGVFIGGLLWASISYLIENNGLPAIVGLAFACLVFGVVMGREIGSD